MLWLLVVLMQPACPNADPPDVPATRGQGWWQDETCTWMTTDCLGAVPVEANQAVRLAAGCTLKRPVVGIHPKTANKLFGEIAEARVQIRVLTEYGTQCYSDLTEANQKTGQLANTCKSGAAVVADQLQVAKAELVKCKDVEIAYRGQLISARLWQAVGAVAGVGVGFGLGWLVFEAL